MKFKKLASLFLACAMVAGMSVGAFAASRVQEHADVYAFELIDENHMRSFVSETPISENDIKAIARSFVNEENGEARITPACSDSPNGSHSWKVSGVEYHDHSTRTSGASCTVVVYNIAKCAYCGYMDVYFARNRSYNHTHFE